MFVRKTQEADRGLEESGVSDYTVFFMKKKGDDQ